MLERWSLAIVLALALGACGEGSWLVRLGLSDEQAPAGPPRCEPDAELVTERALKAAWRALAEREVDNARAAFTAILASEPNHPEALRGLALLDHPLPCDGPEP